MQITVVAVREPFDAGDALDVYRASQQIKAVHINAALPPMPPPAGQPTGKTSPARLGMKDERFAIDDGAQA